MAPFFLHKILLKTVHSAITAPDGTCQVGIDAVRNHYGRSGFDRLRTYSETPHPQNLSKTKKMERRSDVTARQLALAQAIHTILDQRGVSPRQHRAALEAALEMKYQQVRRRMTGETTWAVGEIARLASYFGESVFKLLAILIDEEGQPASLRTQGVSLGCTVWPGECVPKDKAIGPLVAVRSEPPGSWVVMPVADVGDKPVHQLKRLMIEEAARARVAVVDADAEWAGKTVQFLQKKGLEAVHFQSFGSARSAIEASQFDGFLLDWSLGEEACEALLKEIRSKTAGPVLMLLKPNGDDNAMERVAAVVVAYRAQIYEKPTSFFSLYNALELGFAAAGGRAAR